MLALVATACGSESDSVGLEGAEPGAPAEQAEPETDAVAEQTQPESDAPAEQAEPAEVCDNSEPVAVADDGSAYALGADAGFPITVVADGGEVTLEAAPQRIVSLSPTGTEMLFAIGAGPQVIAVDSFSYYPPEAPVTDLSAFTPNVEAIAGFDPDFIVLSGPVEGIEVLGVPTITQFAAPNLSTVYAQIEQLGAATGNVGGAVEVVVGMQTDIAEISAGLPATNCPLTFFHELDPTLYSVTSQTFVGEIYSLAGLRNIADAADPDGEFFGYPQITEEFIVAADPDVIFLADTVCCEQNATAVGERPGWGELQAVRNGNVVELNDDVASRWGPRVVDLFREVAAAASAANSVGAS